MGIDEDMWAVRYEMGFSPSFMSTAGKRLADEIDRLRAELAERDALRAEINRRLGCPSTARIWHNGVLVFDGVSHDEKILDGRILVTLGDDS